MSRKADSFPRETLKVFEENYLPFFRKMLETSQHTVPISALAKKFRIEERQVRRQMASLTGSGELRSDYDVEELVTEIEHYLGFHNCKDVALIGTGHIGRALLDNKGFAQYGLDLSWVFDPDAKEERLAGAVHILPLSHFDDIAARMHVHLGILAVSSDKAQAVAERMMQAGVLAIWNVSRTPVTLPHKVLLINETFGEHEDIANNEAVALSLSVLKEQLKYKMGWEK